MKEYQYYILLGTIWIAPVKPDFWNVLFSVGCVAASFGFSDRDQ